MGSIRIWESSKGIFCICLEKASDKVDVGIGAITTAKRSDVVGDIAAEEGGVVMAKEESITITNSAEGEGARWTEMSTAGGDVAIMAREVGGMTVGAGRAKRGSN